MFHPVMSAAAESFTESRSTPPWRLLLAVLLTGLLWPSLVSFPFKPETSLDASWQLVLIHAHAQGWQFGRDLIFTWGPWGFLNSVFHFGGVSATPKLIWETAGKLLLAVGLVGLTFRLPWWRQTLFVAVCALVNWFFLDVVFLVVIALAVVVELLPSDRPAWRRLLWTAALALLAQIKFIYAVAALAGVCAAAGAGVTRRDWRAAAVVPGGFALAFLLFWMLAGQNPDNLLPYFRLSWEISRGYADAMMVDEPLGVFLCGVALLLAASLFVWRLFQRPTDRSFSVAAALFLGFTWFLVWKHGFTRADGHVFGFFFYTLLVAIVLPGVCFPNCRWHWFDLTAALAILGASLTNADLVSKSPLVAGSRLLNNSRALLRPAQWPAWWENSLAEAREAHGLPEVRRVVGSASVDVFNHAQGAALLNGLNYVPRPVFQSYSAYTPRLLRLNLRFYQSSRAPDFVLWNHASIDFRFPTLDDSLLVAELARGYELVLEEGGFLLLKRIRPLPAGRFERHLLHAQGASLDEDITVPTVRDRALWLQADLSLSKLGRLRAALYKPPLLHMVVTDDSGRQTAWRMLPRVAEEGLILQPFLESLSDFAAFLRGHGRRWIRTVRFEAPRGQREFWGRLTVGFFVLPGLPLTPEMPFGHLVDDGVVNVVPESVKSHRSVEVFPLGLGRALLVHAPGEIVFVRPPGATVLRGIYGLREGSYNQGGRTDGVEFLIEFGDEAGHAETLWRRHLDPVNRPEHRGPRSFAVTLPPHRTGRVILRTLPGPRNDTDWDWSYWASLHFDQPATR